jgi:four helix bundle protein
LVECRNAGLLTDFGVGIKCALRCRVRSKADELKARTARFAEEITQLVRSLPNTLEARKAAGQLFDSATSVAANYRAACKARSHREFVAKIGIVLEEADESEFWLGFLASTNIVDESAVARLRGEASELAAIFTASHKTATSRKPEYRDRNR